MAESSTGLPSHSLHAGDGRLGLNRSFLLLWAAYGVSAMGDHISEMALLKTQNALEATNLTSLQAMITFMFMLPFFVFGPINGMVADRLPRRGIMIFADLVRAILMFKFAFLIAQFEGFGQVWAFTPLLIVGVFAAMFSPARAALLPELVQENQLVRANAMISGLGVIASMAAVLIGGYLARHYAPSVAFHVDAATFIVSALLLVAIRIPPVEQARHRTSVGPRALTEAVGYVRSHRRVAQLILVAVVVWSCGALVRTTIPAIVRDVYQRPDYLEISGFQARLGLGMLIGAVILTTLGNALRSEIAITWSLAGIAGALGLLTLTVLAPVSATFAYHAGGVAIILSGVFATGVMASYNALLQRIVPNRLRGRVFGLTDLATMAGLLLATGLLGIPHWPGIDRWIGWILLGVTGTVAAAALGSLWVRLHSSHLSPILAFWWNLNTFYCRWRFRLKREGICTVPVRGPAIVVANHTCSIDPLLLIASIPHRVPAFLVAAEYAELPTFGRLTAMIECIPIRREQRDAAGTRAALRHLKAGKLLGVFIEGRIPRPGEEVEPKEGPALLALRTGAVLVPACIVGTRYDETLMKPFLRRHNARVRFGAPIDVSSMRGNKPAKVTIQHLTELLRREIYQMRDQAEKEKTDSQ